MNQQRIQTLASLTMLAVVLGTCLAIDLLARSVMRGRLSEKLQAHRREQWRQTNSIYRNRHGWSDHEEYMALDEMPEADYCRGGVVFVSASVMRQATMLWEEPADRRRLLHNYSLSSSNHSDVRQWLRYLLDYEGIARAGNGRMMIVLGLHYPLAREHRDLPGIPDRQYLRNLFARWGLHRYSEEEGIRPIAMSSWKRTFLVERLRCANFLHHAWRNQLNELFIFPAHDERMIREYRDYYTTLMGDDWREIMARQVEVLDQTLDDLARADCRVTCVYLPLGPWQQGLPFPQAYHELTLPICRKHGVPVHDLSNLLTDVEFADSSHANYRGQKKLHAELMKIVLPHVESLNATTN